MDPHQQTREEAGYIVFEYNAHSPWEAYQGFAVAFETFCRDLQRVLARSLPVIPPHYTASPAPVPLGWLSLRLKFASMTIANRCLTRISEDLATSELPGNQTAIEHVDLLLNEQSANQNAQSGPAVQLIVNVTIPEGAENPYLIRGGTLITRRFAAVVDALCTLPQLLADVQSVDNADQIKTYRGADYDELDQQWVQRP